MLLARIDRWPVLVDLQAGRPYHRDRRKVDTRWCLALGARISRDRRNRLGAGTAHCRNRQVGPGPNGASIVAITSATTLESPHLHRVATRRFGSMHIPQNAWALEHHRFGLAGEGQADVVERHLARHRGVVADVGCGPQGQHASNLARLCRRLIAVDKDPGMVRAASLDLNAPNISFVAANAYDLPFTVAAFDSVVTLGLLAYITDVARLLAEFRRVVRKGGTIMLTDSVSRSEKPVLSAAEEAGLRLIEELEARCPAASGSIKRRRLFVFART